MARDKGWYLPDVEPRHPWRRPPRRTLAGDLAAGWRRFRSMRAPVQVAIGAGVFVLGAIAAGAINEDGRSVETTGSPATAASASPAADGSAGSTTSTTAALPAGDDTAVATVIDGDSFAVDDGTRIRLIGVNTPEIETGDCYSAEATARQRELIGPGTRVRLVYDEQRTDRFGRTLAYVYRLTDGLFVNETLARDGFADEQTQAPNTRHAERFRQAVAEARNANRGMWSACSPATTGTSTTASTPRPVASPVTTPVTSVAPAPTAVVTSASAACHPAYAGVCLPIVSDVDCAGGGGNGPYYTSAKRFRSIGSDPYDLDRDKDGIACET